MTTKKGHKKTILAKEQAIQNTQEMLGREEAQQKTKIHGLFCKTT